jgi:inward rectifier potassium channel
MAEVPPLLRKPPAGSVDRPRFVERSAADRLRVIGRHRGLWGDVYHSALRLSWTRFLLLGTALFLILNSAFAVLYSLQPSGITDLKHGSLTEAFFFSVQTLATIGYGRWAPVSTYANAVVTVETLLGVSTIAVFTALAFARFARPTAKIVFSRNLVVTQFDGVPTLLLRVANERDNQILEARVGLYILRDETTPEGQYFRRLYDLALVRDHSPVLGMTFQVMHRIDEKSPLYGYTSERMEAEWVEVIALVTGLDETMMQNVHARASYDSKEILFGRRFADIFGYLADGTRAMDYRKFHETEPS